MIDPKYVLLLFASDNVDPLRIADEARAAHRETLCWYCNGPMRPKSLPGDVVVASKPRNALFQSVSWHYAKIVRADFIDILGDEIVQSTFKVGRVLDKSGNVISGFVSLFPKSRSCSGTSSSSPTTCASSAAGSC